jgi:hypothetical protein
VVLLCTFGFLGLSLLRIAIRTYTYVYSVESTYTCILQCTYSSTYSNQPADPGNNQLSRVVCTPRMVTPPRISRGHTRAKNAQVQGVSESGHYSCAPFLVAASLCSYYCWQLLSVGLCPAAVRPSVRPLRCPPNPLGPGRLLCTMLQGSALAASRVHAVVAYPVSEFKPFKDPMAVEHAGMLRKSLLEISMSPSTKQMVVHQHARRSPCHRRTSSWRVSCSK